MSPAPTALVQEQVLALVPPAHICGSDGVLDHFLLNSPSLWLSPGSKAQAELPITFPGGGRTVTMTPSLRLSAIPGEQRSEAELCCCSGAQGNEEISSRK